VVTFTKGKTMANAETKTTVVVVVAKERLGKGWTGPQGWWSLGASNPGRGRYFPPGQTRLDVRPDELAELQHDADHGFIELVTR
jgi:hypothetical protein